MGKIGGRKLRKVDKRPVKRKLNVELDGLDPDYEPGFDAQTSDWN